MVHDRNSFYILHVEDEDRYVVGFRKLVELVLKEEHDLVPERIIWTVVRNKEAALRAIHEAERAAPGRGYDAVLCDLRIPPDSDHTTEEYLVEEHGFDVARAVAACGWPGSLVGLTQWAGEASVLKRLQEEFQKIEPEAEQKPVFDDLLLKSDLLDDATKNVARAKFARLLIPVERYAAEARKWEPPTLFLGPAMLRLLRDLIFISRRPVASWPLPMMLLLGPPGSGKGELAYTFDRLLRRWDEDRTPVPEDRPIMKTENCAALVAMDHGGRIRLFGCDGAFQGLGQMKGCFEAATRYKEDGQPDYERGGVVFLDEFAMLKPELQAAVLNTLQEGVVHKADSGREVRIGCYVVLATNSDVGKLLGTGDEVVDSERSGKRIRNDLIDRIPFILETPPLMQQREHIPELLQHLAAYRHNSLAAWEDAEIARVGADAISIKKSALQTIDAAVRLGVINSMRHLKSITDLNLGEVCITDSNLVWVIRRARVLGVSCRELTGEPSAELPSEGGAVSGGARPERRARNVELRPLISRMVAEAPAGKLGDSPEVAARVRDGAEAAATYIRSVDAKNFFKKGITHPPWVNMVGASEKAKTTAVYRSIALAWILYPKDTQTQTAHFWGIDGTGKYPRSSDEVVMACARAFGGDQAASNWLRLVEAYYPYSQKPPSPHVWHDVVDTLSEGWVGFLSRLCPRINSKAYRTVSPAEGSELLEGVLRHTKKADAEGAPAAVAECYSAYEGLVPVARRIAEVLRLVM